MHISLSFLFFFSFCGGCFVYRIPEKTGSVDKALVRASLCVDLRKLAESNPSLCGKLVFPNLNKSALLSLIALICPNSNVRMGGSKVKFCSYFSCQLFFEVMLRFKMQCIFCIH